MYLEIAIVGCANVFSLDGSIIQEEFCRILNRI